MTANIKVMRLHSAVNKSPDGRTFEVCYVNGDDGKSYTAYKTTPGFDLLKEGVTVTLNYKTNISKGKTYHNLISVEPSTTQTNVSQEILSVLQNINHLLGRLLESRQTEVADGTCGTHGTSGMNSTNSTAQVPEPSSFDIKNVGNVDELPF